MGGERYEHQKNMVKRISRVTTMLVPDNLGVDLRFINNNQRFTDLREDEINDAVSKVSPDGGTKIGLSLENQILNPLVYEPLSSGGLKRPLLISIITDGEPTDNPRDRFQKAILRCKQKLVREGYPHFCALTPCPVFARPCHPPTLHDAHIGQLYFSRSVRSEPQPGRTISFKV